MKKSVFLTLAICLMSIPALATTPPPSDHTIYISLASGQVIEVPKGGEVCKFHKIYCPKGWKKDGSFPFTGGQKFMEAVITKIKGNAYAAGYEAGVKTCGMTETEKEEIPDCTGELVVSPHICKPTEPVETQQCEAKLVVSPAYGPACED